MKKFTYIGIIFLFLLVRWNSFNAPFERDEGEYSYAAWLMRQNQMPYEHAFLQKPPMIIYTYMIAQLISEDSHIPPRILAALSVGLSTLLVGMIASREYGNWVGLSAMWIMTPMFGLSHLVSFAANTEVFMILPLLIMIFIYTTKRDKADTKHWFVSGILAAISIMYKPIVIFVILFFYIVWFIEIWKTGRGTFVVAKYALSAFSGIMLTTLLILFPFLLHDWGKKFWECVIAYNIEYTTTISSGPAPFLSFVKVFWSNWWILFLLLIWFLFIRPKRWWYYMALFVVSIVSISQAHTGHYYILLIPFWAIISAISLNSIFWQFNRFTQTKKTFVLALIIILLILPIHHQFTKSPQEMVDLVYGGIMNPFIEARTVAEKVASLSSPSDYIFVAGSEPEILYYAKRKSSSRFVIMYPLMFNTPFAKQYQEETIQSLETNPPKIIVQVRSKMSWLIQNDSPLIIVNYLNKLLSSRYHLAGGYHVGSKLWLDKIDDNVEKGCSMLVYKRDF